MYPFAKKTLTGDTHLYPERAEDELASARGAHGDQEVGVPRRVDSGSVDRRAFLEQVRELGAVGLLRPDETLTVECTIGSPQVCASFTVDTMFFRTTSDPWTGPRRSARAARRSRAEPHAGA